MPSKYQDLSYPSDIVNAGKKSKSDSRDDSVSFVRFDIFDRINARKFEHHRSINLYMPETMENPTQLSWDQQSLGAGGAGAFGSQSFRNYENAITASMSQGKQYIDAMKRSMGSKLFGGSDVTPQDQLAHHQQAIVNPYMKMLFRGVNFRNFEMQFRFTPHNAKEAKEIYNICQCFRASALPENEDAHGYKWKYPRELEIQYRYQGREHPWLNKFKRCVITNAHINYTGAGNYVSMRDGFPAETVLQLQFSEIDLLTRKDLEGERAFSNGEYTGPSY